MEAAGEDASVPLPVSPNGQGSSLSYATSAREPKTSCTVAGLCKDPASEGPRRDVRWGYGIRIYGEGMNDANLDLSQALNRQWI